MFGPFTRESYDEHVFAGFSKGVKTMNPTGLINLQQTKTPLSTRLTTFFLRAAQLSYITMLHVCFPWGADTPPSGEPDTARLPIYQGEAFKACLTDPTLCKPEGKHSKETRGSVQSIICTSRVSTYPSSHSTRPCLITFWYQRPCHFCHSFVKRRTSWERLC